MTGRDQLANVDVFLILRDGGGRLLLGLRGPDVYHGGQWNLVSGKADTGEDVLSAVVREAAEETGLMLAEADRGGGLAGARLISRRRLARGHGRAGAALVMVARRRMVAPPDGAPRTGISARAETGG